MINCKLHIIMQLKFVRRMAKCGCGWQLWSQPYCGNKLPGTTCCLYIYIYTTIYIVYIVYICFFRCICICLCNLCDCTLRRIRYAAARRLQVARLVDCSPDTVFYFVTFAQISLWLMFFGFRFLF